MPGKSRTHDNSIAVEPTDSCGSSIHYLDAVLEYIASAREDAALIDAGDVVDGRLTLAECGARQALYTGSASARRLYLAETIRHLEAVDDVVDAAEVIYPLHHALQLTIDVSKEVDGPC